MSEKIQRKSDDEIIEGLFDRMKVLKDIIRGLCDAMDEGDPLRIDKAIYQARALLDDKP